MSYVDDTQIALLLVLDEPVPSMTPNGATFGIDSTNYFDDTQSMHL